MKRSDYIKTGKLYLCNDSSLVQEQLACLDKLYDFNNTRPSEMERRMAIMCELLGSVGKNCYIEPPLHANWGRNTHLGDNVYANFNLTLVDDADVFIGSNVMIGPNVVLSTAGHPVDPELRRRVAQFNLPIRIGDNVWLGAGVIVMPGITIGDNSVIGAGSIVTKDIPANVVAVGNPCRVMRPISERDREYYHKDRKIDLNELGLDTL